MGFLLHRVLEPARQGGVGLGWVVGGGGPADLCLPRAADRSIRPDRMAPLSSTERSVAKKHHDEHGHPVREQ